MQNKIVEFVMGYGSYNAGEKAGFPPDMANHLVTVRKVAKFPEGATTLKEDAEERRGVVIAKLNEMKVGFFKGATLEDLEAKLAGAINAQEAQRIAADEAAAEAATTAMVALEAAQPDRPKFSTLTFPELTAVCAKLGFHIDFADLPNLALKRKMASDAYDVQA